MAKADLGLNSEAQVIEEQAKQAQSLKEGENLLKKPPAPAVKNAAHELKT